MSKMKVNQLVDIQYFREGWEGTYKTRVEDLQDNTVVLGIPFIDGGGLLPVKRGESIILRYFDQVASYSAQAVVSQVIFTPLPLFKIPLPENVKRVQRRSYVRIEAKLPIKFTAVNTDETITTTTIDVSGGGVRFHHSQAVEARTILKLEIYLKGFSVACQGEVVRSVWEKKDSYQICVKFIDLNEKQINDIVAWVFKEQLELRKRGLI